MGSEGGSFQGRRALEARVDTFLAERIRSRRRTFSVDELELWVREHLGAEGYVESGEYQALACVVEALCRAGRLVPVKSRGRNGRRPPLYCVYRAAVPVRGEPALPPGLHPRLDRAGVRRFLPRDREAVQAVSDYLFAHPDRHSRRPVPRNERSLELFGDEKFLERRPGFLRALGLDLADIHAFVPREPFLHRVFGEPVREALAVENLSAFVSVCGVLDEGSWRWGPRPDLVIYGEGKKILRSIEFLIHFPDTERVLYVGDLDPEGVGILAALRACDPRVVPSEPLYGGMLARKALARRLVRPAVCTDVEGAFRGAGDLAERVRALFRQGLWIPQEALGWEALRAGPPQGLERRMGCGQPEPGGAGHA